MRSDTRETLVVAIAKARRWFGELSSRRVESFEVLAAREGCSERYVRSILPLAFLAPEITRAALERRLTEDCGVSQAINFPESWQEQKRRLGLAGVT